MFNTGKEPPIAIQIVTYLPRVIPFVKDIFILSYRATLPQKLWLYFFFMEKILFTNSNGITSNSI